MYDQMFKFWVCLDDHPNGSNAILLLMELESYFDGAALQTARLNRTRKTIIRQIEKHREARKIGKHISEKSSINHLSRLQHDYHYYFICISQINKILKRLYKVLDDTDMIGVYYDFHRKFGIAIEIRGDLEHIDERALGKKWMGTRKEKDIGHVADFGNFTGDSFTFHGKEFQVNKETLKELDQIYKEIINVLYKNYGSKDPCFVHMEQNEKLLKRILRKSKKQNPHET